MARTPVFVWHGLSGEIVAVGRPMSSSPCIPIASDGVAALQTEVEEEEIADLASTHRVDLAARALVKGYEPAGG